MDSASLPEIFLGVDCAGRDKKAIYMVYRNYRGEISERCVIPDRIWFGATSYHPAPQWLMDAFDVDKGERRAFALNDIKKFVQRS